MWIREGGGGKTLIHKMWIKVMFFLEPLPGTGDGGNIGNASAHPVPPTPPEPHQNQSKPK